MEMNSLKISVHCHGGTEGGLNLEIHECKKEMQTSLTPFATHCKRGCSVECLCSLICWGWTLFFFFSLLISKQHKAEMFFAHPSRTTLNYVEIIAIMNAITLGISGRRLYSLMWLLFSTNLIAKVFSQLMAYEVTFCHSFSLFLLLLVC